MKTIWEADFPIQEFVENKTVKHHIDMEEVRSEVITLGHKLICRSVDKKKLVQLAGSFVTVNHLAKYPGWNEGFRDLILEQTQKVFNYFKIDTVTQIGLRYIDRINIPQCPLNWQDWFETQLGLPKPFQRPGAKIQFNFQNSLAKDLFANLTVVSVEPSSEGMSSVILDLDILSKKPLKVSEVPAELERVHKPHRLAFEAILKDNTRALFSPE